MGYLPAVFAAFLMAGVLGMSGCGKDTNQPLAEEERLKPTDESAGALQPDDFPAHVEEVDAPEVEISDANSDLFPQDLDATGAGDTRKPSFVDEFLGLEYSGYVIPYKGKKNRFLAPFGHSTEPTGKIVDYRGFFSKTDFVEGKVSWFGGPKDTGVTSKETGAISGEVLRKLNPKSFYAAMRFDYGNSAAEGRAFWKSARLLVVNPRNGRAVVVRPVDWGPNPRLNRVIDLSPGALEALGGVMTDESVWVSFAKPNTSLGLVR